MSPAKRLADELEVLHAVETLTKTEARRVPEVMQHIAESAASSLSCELAVLSLHDRAEVAVAGRDWPVDADADEIAAAMREVSERETAPAICVHDTTSDPLPAPFTRAAGIRPHYLLSIGKPSMRLVLLMHADACPRGFTMLCRQLGLRLAESAEGLLRGAVIRELEEQHAVALAKANERLVEVNRMKDDFVAFIVHELRTPLTSIRGYVDLLVDGEVGELRPDQLAAVGVVDRNAHRLLRLVDDLLFVARAEAGRFDLELSELDLGALVAESAEAAKPAAVAKEIELAFAADPAPPMPGDRTRLGQLVDNLISNAVKFTPNGGRVGIRLRAQGARATLEVADSGIRIAPSEQARLFDRFFRASSATARAIPGTGLGLVISKAIAEAHDGTISVESREGAGTTFRVELPLAPAARQEAA